MFDSNTHSRRSPILALAAVASMLLHLAFVLGAAQLSLIAPSRPLAHVTGTQVDIEVQEVSVVVPAETTADAGTELDGERTVL